MDRRQRKSREAIFNAFSKLLAKKDFNHITVGEIIDLADVGRATFYSHFETKDFLLKEFCEDLFCHIFDAQNDNENGHRHIFNCDSTDSVFLHLLKHLKSNDNNILTLLSSENSDLFSKYFKNGLEVLVEEHFEMFATEKNRTVPKSFVINHVSSAFTETLKWWIDHGMKESPETIWEYFFSVV